MNRNIQKKKYPKENKKKRTCVRRSNYVIASTLAAITIISRENTWKPHLIGEQTYPWVRRPTVVRRMGTKTPTDCVLLLHTFRIL